MYAVARSTKLTDNVAQHSLIEWTDATWSPITGCSILSAGCRRCYAMKLAGTRLRNHPSRAGLTIDTPAGPVWTGEVRFNAQWLNQPLRMTRPRLIFVCAHSDLFHPAVPFAWIDRVFGVMWACYAMSRGHIHQVLTKRPDRALEYLSTDRRHIWAELAAAHAGRSPGAAYVYDRVFEAASLPHPQIWLMTTVENQRVAPERLAALRACPAAVRGVSCEPLLSHLDLLPHLLPRGHAFHGADDKDLDVCSQCGRGAAEHDGGIHWVIVGGESARDARPMHPEWARSLREQCRAAGVAYFFKQWGSWQIASLANGDADPSMDRKNVAWVHNDGVVTRPSWKRVGVNVGRPDPTDTQPYAMRRVPKKKAGRVLDGQLHDEFPNHTPLSVAPAP